MRNFSIQRRTLIAASTVLLIFLGTTAAILDRAFRESAEQTVSQRLEAYFYGLLAVAELTPDNMLEVPEFLADERFNRPNSGLYAYITRNPDQIIWRSHSLLGKDTPQLTTQRQGQSRFITVGHDSNLFSYSYGVAWELDNQQTINFTFYVLSSAEQYHAQINEFRYNLWLWFTIATLVLLIAQLLLLRWSLAPLRHVADDLEAVESGVQQTLSGNHPRELRKLTDRINQLLASQQRQLQRYRNALDDLAHSLKTPLAVIRGTNEPHVIQQQTDRMTQLVNYQLQRAATAGIQTLGTQTPLQQTARRLIDTFSKVYADKQLAFKLNIEDERYLAVEQNDLMEILGNLIDNACKWAKTTVHITSPKPDTLIIEDDGPGIENHQIDRLLQRGQRADCSVEGQGIGLAVVSEIVNACDIHIAITRRAQGGTRVTLRF